MSLRVARIDARYVAIFALMLGCSRGGQQAPRVETVQGPAGVVHVDDGGSGGVPVVFVHSFAGSTAHWKAQLAHLRPSRRAIALDLRGHGLSAALDGDDYSVEGFAADIDAAVTALGLDNFVLVGHSLGGAAALAYAGAHPDRVAGLVLVGAPGKVPAEQATQIMQSIEVDFDSVMAMYWDQLLVDAQPAVRTQVESDMRTLSRRASMHIIRALFEYDPLPALQIYTGPKLAVVTPHGDDPTALHHLVPDLPKTMVTGTSHWLHMDKPDEFNRILDGFLETAV